MTAHMRKRAYKGHQTKNGFDCQRHASYAPPVYRWSNYGHRCNSKPFAAIRRQCIEACASSRSLVRRGCG